MNKKSGETSSKDSKLARRDFVRTTAAAGGGLLIVPSAIAFGSTADSSLGLGIIGRGGPSVPFSKACDVGQGYYYKKEVHHTFGYINTFLLGKTNITPDTYTAAIKSGIISKPVVSVLSQVNWSTVPNENIIFEGRISLANQQQLKYLTQMGVQDLFVSVSFVVFEYDPGSQVYFTCFKSYKGSVPIGNKLAQPVIDEANPPIHGVVPKIGNQAGIFIAEIADKVTPDLESYPFSLHLAPTVAPARQQILIPTSAKNKRVLPWGILKA